MLSCSVSLLGLRNREIRSSCSSDPPLLFLSQTECSYSWCFSWAHMKSCHVFHSFKCWREISWKLSDLWKIVPVGGLPGHWTRFLAEHRWNIGLFQSCQAADRTAIKVLSRHWTCQQLTKWYHHSCHHHSHCMTAQQHTSEDSSSSRVQASTSMVTSCWVCCHLCCMKEVARIEEKNRILG